MFLSVAKLVLPLVNYYFCVVVRPVYFSHRNTVVVERIGVFDLLADVVQNLVDRTATVLLLIVS